MLYFVLMVLACMIATALWMVLGFVLFTRPWFMKWYMKWVTKQSNTLINAMFDEDEEAL